MFVRFLQTSMTGYIGHFSRIDVLSASCCPALQKLQATMKKSFTRDICLRKNLGNPLDDGKNSSNRF